MDTIYEELSYCGRYLFGVSGTRALAVQGFSLYVTTIFASSKLINLFSGLRKC